MMERMQELPGERGGELGDGSASWVTWLGYWGPVLVWSVILYVMSAQPSLPRPGESIGLSDDVVNYATHALSYGMLAWLAWRPLAAGVGRLSPLVCAYPELTAALYAVFYGISDEIHQAFVPGRTASVWDVLADALGALLVAVIIWAVRLRGRLMHD